MRDIQSENSRMHKNVEDCVHGMNDMMERQKRLEEEQQRQSKLLKQASRPPSGLPSPPPVSPVPPRRGPDENIQAAEAPREESERERDVENLTQALRDLPWIDSEV